MATDIEWADEVWNPTLGCERVSEGCDNCYAIGMAARGMVPEHRGLTADGDWTGEVRMLDERLMAPMRWRTPRRVFVDSMSDLFHKDVAPSFQLDVWQTMAATQRHTYQVLTKRPQAMARFCGRLTWAYPPATNVGTGEPFLLPEGTGLDCDPLLNVWLGTSIESDRYAWRADHLRATPAAVRFLSLEPLLGPLPSLDLAGIDWVIVGGESGPRARPMHPAWATEIRDRCVAAGIPLVFKQWGNWVPDHRLITGNPPAAWVSEVNGAAVADINAVRHGSHWRLMRKVGKHAAGRRLEGRTWDQYPAPHPGTGHAA